jgi:hypothetical protein
MNYKMQINTVTLRYLTHINRQQKVRRVHGHAYVGIKDARTKSSRNYHKIYLGCQWKNTENTIVENGQESTTGTSKSMAEFN